MKMSWSYYLSRRLRFKPPRCINAMILHSLIPRVGKHNIKTVKGLERMGKARGVKRIKRVREIEKAIREIS